MSDEKAEGVISLEAKNQKTSDIISTLNESTNLVVKIAIVLGGGVILTYAIEEHILPDLLSSISIPMLLFLGATSTFVVGLCLCVGLGLSYWLVAIRAYSLQRTIQRFNPLLSCTLFIIFFSVLSDLKNQVSKLLLIIAAVVIATALGFLTLLANSAKRAKEKRGHGFKPIVRWIISSPQDIRHKFLASSKSERWLYSTISLFIFIIFMDLSIKAELLNNEGFAYLTVYLFFVTIVIHAVLDSDVPSVKTWPKVAGACFIPFFILLYFPKAIPALTRLPMTLMGFRSVHGDAIIVDANGFKEVSEQAEVAGVPLLACRISDLKETKWRLIHGMAVWYGLGDRAFIKASDAPQGLGPTFSLPITAVTVLRGVNLNSTGWCLYGD